MYAVIMAGGRGTRFWPRSRSTLPKQMLDITGEKTMIQQTVERILPVVNKENIYIVTNIEQLESLKKQLPNINESNIIAEPFGRNTAPCICLAAAKITKDDPDAVMAVLPADHYMGDNKGFCDCISKAGQVALESSALVTIGITPDKPETGYGYIEFDEENRSPSDDAYNVITYHEKPDINKARDYLSKGNYLWNSGMFVWKVETILKNIKRFLPETYREIMNLSDCFDTPDFDKSLKQAYEMIESISIDYGVLEKADSVLTIKGDFGWNDIGSWTAIHDISEKDKDNNVLIGDIISVDSSDSLVYNKKKLTAIVGIKDVYVVETDDALLICSKDKVQDVRKVVDELEKKGKFKYL
jgi:mannose-1-phosphate guanylyltransferase